MYKRQILDGVEGLVHVSEMDWTNKNIHPSKVVSLGDTVEVMVLEVDEERRRISLGLKQCKPNPAKHSFPLTHGLNAGKNLWQIPPSSRDGNRKLLGWPEKSFVLAVYCRAALQCRALRRHSDAFHVVLHAVHHHAVQIGRASCRERVSSPV